MVEFRALQHAVLDFLDKELWLIELFAIIFLTSFIAMIIKKIFFKHFNDDKILPKDHFQTILIFSEVSVHFHNLICSH